MVIKIGDKIKDLRTNKNVTQERFAQYLGISPETVMQWENGECYPPLEAIVALADYFRVTTDELLCIEQFSSEERIKSYTERYDALMNEGKILPAIDTMRDALTHFPDNYRFKCMLMYALYCNCDRKNTVRFSSPEVIALGNDILSGCTDDDVRVEARRMLVMHYYGDLGDAETALELAGLLPDRLSSREEILPLITDGEVKKSALQQNIAAYTELLIRAVKDIADTEAYGLSDTDTLASYNLTLQLARLVHPDGDYLALAPELCDSCKAIAALHMHAGEQDKALDALDAAAHFAAAYDRMPRAVKHSSPLLDTVVSLKTDADNRYIVDGQSLRQTLAADLLALSCFEPIRYSDKMKSICESLNAE